MPRISKSKSMATVKQKGIERAKRQSAVTESTESNLISTQGGELTLNDRKLPEPFYCIVLDQCIENAKYGKEWEPGSKEIPICFAISPAMSQLKEGETLLDNLKPHHNSPDPQSDSCATCPHNEFGSAEKGGGKACGNRKRISLVPADTVSNPNPEVAMLKIPPTGLKPLNSYIAFLNRVEEIPLEFAISAVSMRKLTPTSIQKTPAFEFDSVINVDVVEDIDKLIEATRKDLVRPYEKMSEKEPVKATRKKAATKSTAAIRKKAANRRA